LSREELEELEKREIYIHDQRNAITRAMRLGREQGREEGREEGMREAKLEIAKQLLDVLDEESISQKTGLSLEEVQKLKEGG
jgi:predicted transposase/invertase (TIGR01784 family)